MRIGLFTHVYPPMINGVAVSVKNLEQELKNQGHEVFIITNNYDKFSNDFSDNHNIKVTSIPIYYQNLRTPVLYNPEIYKKLKELNLDIVHSHSDFGIGLISRIYSKIDNKPHIQTYHCNYLEYANQNFGQLIGNCCKFPVKMYTKGIAYTTDRLISPSNETFKILKDNFKINRNIDIIPNGLNLDKFKDINYQNVQKLREKYNINSNDFVLLSISRLSKEKRIDEIIKIIPYLKECENLKLLIVGGGPEEINLKELVEKLNISNIIFTGEIQNSEIEAYYRLASIFVSNSIAETQGLTIIEALASSLPVVCINSEYNNDVVIDNKNGLKFSNKDELIEIIKNLYNNRTYLDKLRDYTELSILKYSIKQTTKDIVDIYEEEKKNRL